MRFYGGSSSSRTHALHYLQFFHFNYHENQALSDYWTDLNTETELMELQLAVSNAIIC